MSYIRKSVVDTLTDEELLQLVKSGLDELGIPYEEKPGGFGPGPMLNPSIFDAKSMTEQFALEDYAFQTLCYQHQKVKDCDRVSISGQGIEFECGNQVPWAA